MGELQKFYGGLDLKGRLLFWAVVVVVALSLIRFFAWVVPSRQTVKPRRYEKMLFSKDSRQVRDAMLMLVSLKYKDAAPSLVRLMEETQDENIRRMAAETLLKLDPDKLFGQLKSQNTQTRALVRDVVYRLAPESVGRLFEDYAQEDVDTKLVLLKYAAGCKTPEMREKLVRVFTDTAEDVRVRNAAGTYLKEAAMPDDSALLWQVYNADQNPEIRTLAKEIIDAIEARRRAGGTR